MRYTLFTLIVLLAGSLHAQNKNTVFYDSAGNRTTWEGHWAQVIAGRYKSVYHKHENTKTLERTTAQEFESDLRKTEKKITRTEKVGADFPDFNFIDINNMSLSKANLHGKVVVFNFWFIGCAPCEMERPALNDLAKAYANNPDVVFISLAKNSKEELQPFLNEHPIAYHVVPTGKDFIKSTFEINAYPVNLIVGRDGKYFYNSAASGIGIMAILQKHINRALKE